MEKAEEFKAHKQLKIKIITLSDRASKGEYEDLSGKYIYSQIKEYFSKEKWKIEIEKIIIPDEEKLLKKRLEDFIETKISIIFTTGGTGVGARDITVETVRPFITKEIPGIMEFIRVKYGEKIPNALLSRGISGFMNDTLIFTLPGSLKAVKDYVFEIKRVLEHIIFMQYQIDVH